MSLPPGSRVGIYQVVEMIGVGGMGEVYRATDSRLDRPVAIKTLPEEFSADPERLAERPDVRLVPWNARPQEWNAALLDAAKSPSRIESAATLAADLAVGAPS